MSRKFELYLQDILECCKRLEKYTSETDFESFLKDEMKIDAVVRNLEIIGEAIKNLPPELLEAKPQIEWKKIARFRDIVIHHYFKIDLEIIWDTVQNHLAKLEKTIHEILSELQKPKD